MSFEVYRKQHFNADVLPANHASLDKRGTVRFHTSDLVKLGITDRAVVMLDHSTMRIGIRAPREGESNLAVKVAMVGAGPSKQPQRRKLNLAGAIRTLRISPTDITGRVELMHKDGMAILNLASVRDGSEADQK